LDYPVRGLQDSGVTLFERMPLYQALTDQGARPEVCDMRKQLNLFEKTSGQ